MEDSETRVSRRGFVRTLAGATTATTVAGAASAQETPDGTPTGTPDGTAAGTPTGNGTATGDGTAAGTPAGGQTHTVEMTDDLVYDPESITIAPGDTIEWVNVGSIGHTVTAYGDQIPEGADYFASGGFDSQDAATSAYAPGDPDAGFIPGGGSYQHTFSTTGDYEYYCIPHETAGMVGTVTVEEAGGAPAGGGGGAVPQGQVPDFARNVALALGAGALAVLSMTYLFIKFGGDYGANEEA